MTPIHLACIFNRSKILELLIEQGAEVDDKDEFGALPIHKAAYVGSLGCVQLLIGKRAFVKAEDIDGRKRKKCKLLLLLFYILIQRKYYAVA